MCVAIHGISDRHTVHPYYYITNIYFCPYLFSNFRKFGKNIYTFQVFSPLSIEIMVFLVKNSS